MAQPPSLASRVAQQRLQRRSANGLAGLAAMRPPLMASSPNQSSPGLVDVLLQAQYCTLDPSVPEGLHWLCSLLSMSSEAFYTPGHGDVDERAALVHLTGCTAAEAIVAAFRPVLSAEAGDIKATPVLHSLCMRVGAQIRGAWIAAHFQMPDASMVIVFSVPKTATRTAYDAFSALLRSTAEIDAQVYRTPVQHAAPLADAFWAETAKGAGARPSSPAKGQKAAPPTDWASEYETYRSVIDGLIEEAMLDYAGGGHGHGHALSEAPEASGGCLHVLEVCAGDGSLAERVLTRLVGGDAQRRGEPPSSAAISTYTCLERNASLAERARQRLARFGSAARVIEGDATQRAAYREAVAPVSSGCFNVVISSGSVLCGQVGSPEGAEAALDLISAVLHEGGLLIATGFSTSFLHPSLLRRKGLDHILRGSLPGAHPATSALLRRMRVDDAPPPPAHAFGRFQFFVLRKATLRTAELGFQQQHAPNDPLFSALAGDPL
jgi:hypothetical protein